MNLLIRAATLDNSAPPVADRASVAVGPVDRLASPAARVRVIDARQLPPADLAAWVALEARALEPNLNLSPHFVGPALRHLDPTQAVEVLVAERTDAQGVLRFIGVAVLTRERAGRFFAWRHLSAYQCRHAFLGHWLLDREAAETAALLLLQALRGRTRGAAALLLPNSPVDGPQWPVMQAAARRLGLRAEAVGERERAVLVPSQGGVDNLKAQMRKQYANVERCRRRLQELGTLDWQLHRAQLPASAVDDFLEVEHTGWKRESGTSLRSCAGDVAFFRAMSAGFAAEGRALFTELRLDGRVIASTCNYISGQVGFAFKVGWDDQYRKFGLGIFNEAELVRRAPECLADLDHIDSGSQAGSFIEMLWAGRRRLALVVVPLGPWGRLVWRAQQGVRALMRRLRARRGGVAASAPAPQAP